MIHMQQVCIAIPTYNERGNLPRLVNGLEKLFEEKGIKGFLVIIDDGSPDGTGELADELASRYSNITVIHRLKKLGLGSAYKTAFREFLEDLEPKIIFEMDADLSHDRNDIPKILDGFSKGFDVVVGSRYVRGGRIVGWSPRRKIISFGANFLVAKLLNLGVSDATSGFRAYGDYVLRSIDLSRVRSEGYAFQVEMLYQCRKIGFKIGESPITFYERRRGKSKLRTGEMLGFLRTVLSLRSSRGRANSPSR